MPNGFTAAGTSAGAASTHPRDAAAPCKRSCCWTPLGHSTTRDHLSTWHAGACNCHTTKEDS